jgi:transcriptional regulator with XRE-family HTH domain
MASRHESHILIPGKKLLGKMNERGLSAAQLAKKAGVSPGTISGIMTKERRVTVRTARRIAQALWTTQPINGLKDILADQIEES